MSDETQVESQSGNGRGGRREGAGRPMLDGPMRMKRHEGRRIVHDAVPSAVATLVTTMLDKAAPIAVRVKCAEAILDRGGLPRRTDVDIEAECVTTSFEIRSDDVVGGRVSREKALAFLEGRLLALRAAQALPAPSGANGDGDE